MFRYRMSSPTNSYSPKSQSLTGSKSLPLTESKSIPIRDPLAQLVQALSSGIKEDALLLSIGSGSWGHRDARIEEQQIPTYIKNMAKAGKKVRILIIDRDFEERWSSRDDARRDDLTDREYFEKHQPVTRKLTDNPAEYIYQLNGSPESTIQIFPCAVPAFNDQNFFTVLQKAIENALNNGSKVFIGNHSNCWSLEQYPLLGDVYNSIKESHPQSKSLQLYTQCGDSLGVRYYLDKLYDEKSFMKHDPNAVMGFMSDDSFFEKNWYPVGDEFKVIPNLKDLANLPEFKFPELVEEAVKETSKRPRLS